MASKVSRQLPSMRGCLCVEELGGLFGDRGWTSSENFATCFSQSMASRLPLTAISVEMPRSFRFSLGHRWSLVSFPWKTVESILADGRIEFCGCGVVCIMTGDSPDRNRVDRLAPDGAEYGPHP